MKELREEMREKAKSANEKADEANKEVKEMKEDMQGFEKRMEAIESQISKEHLAAEITKAISNQFKAAGDEAHGVHTNSNTNMDNKEGMTCTATSSYDVTGRASHSKARADERSRLRVLVGGFPDNTHRDEINKTLEKMREGESTSKYVHAPTLYGSVGFITFDNENSRDEYHERNRNKKFKYNNKELYVAKARTYEDRMRTKALKACKKVIQRNSENSEDVEQDRNNIYYKGIRVAKLSSNRQKNIDILPRIKDVGEKGYEQWEKEVEEEIANPSD